MALFPGRVASFHSAPAKCRSRSLVLLAAIAFPLLPAAAAVEKYASPGVLISPAAAPLVWRFTDLKQVGGLAPTILGEPKVMRDVSGRAAARFNGTTDAIILPVNPLAELKAFTVEILFYPDADGPVEQRFFHAQDEAGRRALIELRLNQAGEWWLDTFLKPLEGNGLPLIDPKKVHRAGRWYWAALRYDGKTMSSFVNGEKELEGELALEPMARGEASVGVRLNRVYWFKGAIAEIRFHPVALPLEQLQKSD